ncbi:MAG: glycoside hydrolase family 2 protein, partial [Nocardioidaceae bacterium]
VVHDEPLDPYGPQMLVHQKAADGNLKLERGLGDHLPKWRDIDDWHWVTQLNQARAIRFGIEHFRSLFPLNTGAVVWQLNDNWPVVSWAAVDGHGIRKPLWFVLRDVYADRLLTVQPRDGVPAIVAHNDSDEPWSTELTVSRRDTGAGGKALATEVLTLSVGGRSASTVELPTRLTGPDEAATEYLEIGSGDGLTTYWYFVEDTALRLRPPSEALTVETQAADAGYDVTVSANSLVKDLTLFPDRLSAGSRVDSGMVTLSAGDSHTFRVSGGPVPDGPIGVPVLRSVNDLLSR